MSSLRSFREIVSSGVHSALDSMRLNGGIRIKRNKSDVMSSIYRSILSAESLDESIKLTIKAFKDNFTFTKVSITLFDYDNQCFSTYGYADNKQFSGLQDGNPLPLHQFTNLPFLLGHKTVLVQDLSKKENLSDIERTVYEKEELRSYFLCPLVGKGELIGSLNFASAKKNAFTKSTMQFCEEVSNGIAVALHQFYLQQKIKTINTVLERKEKDITDSINYARRIQQAKLPTQEQIGNCVPDSFVLYKPKDIVSGDFYYFRRYKSAVYLACSDCTGHGVPGALMSMICSEILDDTISTTNDPSQILAHVNRKVKYSLQQSGGSDSSKDGMDIALCILDVTNGIVKFAGANRPIWIIRNGSNVLSEIKGTKKGIGGSTEESQQFDTHWIKLKPGDSFYLSTDGYADAFGGRTNKKLMTKRFKELLLSIQHKSMPEQKAHLDSFIEDWNCGAEQVDDILVIGARM